LTIRPKGREAAVGDKAQKRLLSVLVVATFVALQIPLKKLVAELVPGKRGPREDVAEAVLQGSARMLAVIFASAFVRGLAEQREPGQPDAARKGRGLEEGGLKVTLEL